MGDAVEGSRESDQKRGMRRRLSVGQNVEVRSTDDGFLGSWHTALVVACHRRTCRVRYDHLLADDGSSNLVDVVHVPLAMEGTSAIAEHCPEYRGFIRPIPPSLDFKTCNLSYGLCIDVYHEDAWWEGVIFDHELDSVERRVFFPDLGDEMRCNVDLMRITQDWDETTEVWRRRGSWLFLELVGNYMSEGSIPVSVKQLWFDMREKKEFRKSHDWTSADRSLWENLLFDAINDNTKITANHLVKVLNDPRPSQYRRSSKEVGFRVTDSDPSSELNTERNLAVATTLNHDTNLYRERIHERKSHVCYDKIPLSMDACTEPGNSCHVEAVHASPFEYASYSGVESCPLFFVEYACTEKSQKMLLDEIRKHLKHLGWKIELIGGSRASRFRYISPEGEIHHSLLRLCKDLVAKGDVPSVSSKYDADPRQSKANEDPDPQSTTPVSLPESDYLYSTEVPEGVLALSEYLKMDMGTTKKKNEWMRKLRVNIRRHLRDKGWVTSSSRLAKPLLMYQSPTGKNFYSLRDACKGYMNDLGGKSSYRRRSVPQTDLGGLSRSRRIRSLNMEHIRSGAMAKFPDNFCENRKGECRSLTHETVEPGITGVKPSRVLSKPVDRGKASTTNKTLQQARATELSCQRPRTVLSWLIDNSVVHPRMKVYYRNDNFSMGEGRITHRGIKCACCLKVYSITEFESHAGSKYRRYPAGLFLSDGRSLMRCLLEANKARRKAKECCESDRVWKQGENDIICSVCHCGGDLILCDKCPSSFHTSCLGLTDTPDGDWFCPSCRCIKCGKTQLPENADCSSDSRLNNCKQCERKFHMGCLIKSDVHNVENISDDSCYCSKQCKNMHLGLRELLGNPILVGPNNLTWTLIKSSNPDDHGYESSDMKTSIISNSKLNVALSVMHECFEAVIEPQTRGDIVEDVLFNKESDLQRLDFRGFYTVLLEQNDELITVANVRIFGKGAAELPLIGTRNKYRRLGMCRILIDELEKKLAELGVEKMILPAVPSLLHTWTTSFGFSKMTPPERLKLTDFIFLQFQDTVMCQKFLGKRHAPESISLSGCQPELRNGNPSGEETNTSVSDMEISEAKQSVVNGHGQDNEESTLEKDNPHGDRKKLKVCLRSNSPGISLKKKTFPVRARSPDLNHCMRGNKAQKLVHSYG